MLLAVLAALFILACFWAGVRDRYDHARWQVEPYYPRYGASNLHVLRWWLGGASALAVVLLLASQAVAHDHSRPHLNNWYQGLRSPAGAPCCDGPHVDAMHLKDVDWTAQGKPGFQYRARIPKTGADMDKARRGERFESEWVDVPDNAVLDQPNLDGTTLVWPTYGYGGKAIRCFMPGPMT